MIDWQLTELGSLCKFQAGDGFSKDKQGSSFGDVPFIKVSDMNLSGNEYRINIANNWVSRTESQNYRVHPASAVVFAKIGEALKSNRRRLLTRPTILDNNMMSAVPLIGVDESWFFYLLRTLDFNEVSRGSALPYLATSDLKKIPVSQPPAFEQRQISSVLSALDDKIELNRRTNETLEAMAQAIFRDWFVDFGPVRRKQAGVVDPVEIMGGLTTDPTKAAELAGLFADALDDEGIPIGWSPARVRDLVMFNPKEPLRKSVVAPYSDMSSLPTTCSSAEAPVMREFTSGMRFRNGDALMARITPCLENGKTAFVDFLPAEDPVGWGSTEFIVMRAAPSIPAPFTYLLCRHPEFREHAIQSMTGTSGRQRAQADSLMTWPMARPTAGVLSAFGEFVNPIFARISAAAAENRTLAETRDYLLPRLMSGAVRVAEVCPEVAS